MANTIGNFVAGLIVIGICTAIFTDKNTASVIGKTGTAGAQLLSAAEGQGVT